MGEEFGRAAYLVLLLVAVGGWMIAANRQQLGKMAQQAAIWGFIFLGAIAAVGLWTDIRDEVAPRAAVMADGARIEIPRGIDGHYHLTLGLNGTAGRLHRRYRRQRPGAEPGRRQPDRHRP